MNALKTTSISVGAYEKFLEEFVSDPNITQIISVVDSDGHEYYEVDYLTQNVIFRTIANRDEGTRDLTPEILKPMVVPRRFTTEQTSTGMKIQFGAGTEETNAEDRVLDPSSVAVKMYAKPYISDVEMDPSKLLSSDTMGVVPANTLLKITYLTNTKKDVNINANSLTTVSSPRMDFMDVASLDPAVVKSVRKSIESTNSEPVTGATPGLNVEDLRRQVQNSFLNQRRAVTIRDYETLGYAMPPKFGALKRIRAIKNPNPRRGNLNMAVVSVDSNDHLTTANAVLKDNLRTWLDKGRMVSDVIEITDAKILNFGINFNVIGDLDKERNVILQACIDSLTDFYNNKPDIGEDFYITDAYKVLKDVEGVIDVVDVNITSKVGANYSNISFDISDNISEDGRSIVMPRNAIYEIKYPNIDIKGAVR